MKKQQQLLQQGSVHAQETKAEKANGSSRQSIIPSSRPSVISFATSSKGKEEKQHEQTKLKTDQKAAEEENMNKVPNAEEEDT